MDWFENNKLLPEGVYGYRKNHSTTMCVERWQLEIIKLTNAKLYGATIFFDFVSGYNMILPHLLDSKLEIYGFSPHARAWIRSFLQDRKHYYIANGQSSEGIWVNDGTDAGRKISSCLFAIYTAESTLIMNEISEKCRMETVGVSNIYADDSTNILWGQSPSEVKQRISLFANMYQLWSNSNGLKIAPEKIQLMYHGNWRDSQELDICGTYVRPEKSVKLLGFYVTHNLKWTDHVSYVNASTRKSLYMLRNIKQVTTPDFFRAFTINTVISRISYGLSLYGAVFPLPSFYGDSQIGCKVVFKKLEIALNHVCRIMIGYKGKYQDMHVPELYERAGILSVSQLCALVSIMEVFTIVQQGEFDPS